MKKLAAQAAIGGKRVSITNTEWHDWTVQYTPIVNKSAGT
jgi:hypothetical protein